MILVGIESTFKNKLIRGPARGGGGGSHVACLNFQTSRVSVYKCLSLIVGFAVTVTIWPREVVLLRFHFSHAVARPLTSVDFLLLVSILCSQKSFPPNQSSVVLVIHSNPCTNL